MDIRAEANYEKMVCSLYIDDEHIKEFNLNKGDVGMVWGYFMYQTEEAPKQLKYHVQIELGNDDKQYANPKLYIFPKYGQYVLATEPIRIKVEGKWEQYLKNHKHYEHN